LLFLVPEENPQAIRGEPVIPFTQRSFDALPLTIGGVTITILEALGERRK
jgi:hypothetical protein